MLRRDRHGGDCSIGATLHHVRINQAFTGLAFLGRRSRVYRRLVALSGARPGDRVLDIGCGGGYLARRLAAAVAPGGQVTGVDAAGSAIRYASRRNPGNCSFAVGAAQDLAFTDRCFDVVTSTLAVHHIPEGSRATAFGEMYRVLRPGGRLLVADFRPGGRPHLPHLGRRHHTIDPVDELASATGFRVEGTGDLPMLRYVLAVRAEDAGPADPGGTPGSGAAQAGA